MELSEGQEEAVMAASRAPVLVLTGGPGCGKTLFPLTRTKNCKRSGCIDKSSSCCVLFSGKTFTTRDKYGRK